MAPGLFEERGPAILDSLVAGASVEDAAVKHDVAARTVDRWLAKGRLDPDGKYGQFARTVDEQRGERDVPTGPMTAAEFRGAIDGAVRSGSIPAMKLWSELYLGDEEGAGEEKSSVVASLADRRRAKGAGAR